ncbi:TetR/AcrR family transcriptional regulator [Salinicola avicenniae]|uniref:TetR/AcrR family transcriptional regulator n=1 Tax=Salinicola avicenniae TaxID=2916836 RepID=UPI002073CA68|nr:MULTISPECIES: TetR/AcrR family transcriptional regulator [unclassified Salinicola]
MSAQTPPHLSPRRKPLQARSRATIEAIFEATIQLLLTDGAHRLTTTRVAERAGVSVGTMYQYFPHKQALLYGLNERYLERLAARIETLCSEQRGQCLETMVGALIDTYWRAKTERADVTRVLYRTAVELDNEALIEAFAARVDAATTAMLASASDAAFTDVQSVNLTLVTVIFGTVRNAFERHLAPSEIDHLRDEVLRMCCAYLRSASVHA